MGESEQASKEVMSQVVKIAEKLLRLLKQSQKKGGSKTGR